jgi:transmembrane sensor
MIETRMRTDMPKTAAEWVARLQGGHLPDDAHAEFRRWLASDTQHAIDFGFASMASRVAEQLGNSVIAHEELKALRSNPNGLGRLFRIQDFLSNFWPASPIIASAAVACLVGLWMLTHVSESRFPSLRNGDIATTAINEISNYDLPDGSTVTVNADSEIRIVFTKERRQVILDRGEAFFEVQHDTKRPFYVAAGVRNIVVTGTKFNVNSGLDGGAIQVAVVEGHVKVASVAQAPSNPTDVALSQGDVILFPEGGPAVRRTVSATSVAGWRSRRLYFESATLSEVLSEVNRYSAKRLVLSDPRLANLAISGYFRAGDNKALLFSLQELYHITANDDGDVLLLTDTPPSTANPKI